MAELCDTKTKMFEEDIQHRISLNHPLEPHLTAPPFFLPLQHLTTPKSPLSPLFLSIPCPPQVVFCLPPKKQDG